MIPKTKPSPKSQGPERDQEPLKEDFKKKPFRNLQQSRKPFKKETFKEVLKEPLRNPARSPERNPEKRCRLRASKLRRFCFEAVTSPKQGCYRAYRAYGAYRACRAYGAYRAYGASRVYGLVGFLGFRV